MNKVQSTIAALVFGMVTIAPAFADDTTVTSTNVMTPTCTCPADKACKDATATDCCRVDASADDCVKNGGSVVSGMTDTTE